MGRSPTPEESRSISRAVGRQIRALRTAKGLRQDQLADAAGLHRTHAGFLERGECTPSIYTLILAARVLGVKASDILREAGQ